jgi:Gly-Xaa carboxypeptidase
MNFIFSSLAAIRERDTELLKDLAQQYNLSFTSFGEEISRSSDAPFYGALTLNEAFHRGLEPAPITPTEDAKPYALLSGTIKTTFNSYRNLTAEEGETDKGIKVAPGMMTGNTGMSRTCFFFFFCP